MQLSCAQRRGRVIGGFGAKTPWIRVMVIAVIC
jgi:hypothetical protein